MSGRQIPRRTLRPEHQSRLRLGCALALLATLGSTASAALADSGPGPAAEASAFASAFADIGPAEAAVLAAPHAVDVTEVMPGTPAPTEPNPATTAPAQLIGTGMASYYGRELAGRRTASGEVFDPAQLTAAHRTLPFGSLVRVTSTRTGQSVVVRINDRGPFTRNRLIDLSQGAAQTIGLVAMGHGEVSLELLAG